MYSKDGNKNNVPQLFMGRSPSIGDWGEWQVQAYIIQEARREGYFIEGDQNQAKRGYVAATRAKACGMQAGTPDMRVIMRKGKIVWIELKKITRGKLSIEQGKWHKQAIEYGHDVYIIRADTPVYGYERFKELMNHYGAFR